MLLTKDTQFLIQGMTGKEGQRALKWMTATGLKVAAGVTPGKGGQEVGGVPVYNSVAEALEHHPDISVSAVYVPPRFALGAVEESLAAGIKLLHVLAEGIPVKDTAIMVEKAEQQNARIIGPSSIGFAEPGIGNVGSMGGGTTSQFLEPKNNDGVVVISKSGGMANTIASMLTEAGIAQSCILGIGGDRLIGTTYSDLLPLIQQDEKSKAVVIIGEIGGSYEEVLAEQITQQKFSKPVVAFISGLFAETLPQGIAFGHAGAIVSRNEGTRQGKIDALQKAGAKIAQKPSQIIELLRQVL
jgi:succinyl-CoA synthetase alpha subunit